MLNKKQLTEEDIKLRYITPAITASWKLNQITMETKITDGKPFTFDFRILYFLFLSICRFNKNGRGICRNHNQIIENSRNIKVNTN